MRFALACLFTLVLSGCINITTELQPSNADVQGVLMGEDCSPIVLGMGLGTNTIENALKDGRPKGDVGEFRSRVKLNSRTSITRSVRAAFKCLANRDGLAAMVGSW